MILFKIYIYIYYKKNYGTHGNDYFPFRGMNCFYSNINFSISGSSCPMEEEGLLHTRTSEHTCGLAP